MEACDEARFLIVPQAHMTMASALERRCSAGLQVVSYKTCKWSAIRQEFFGAPVEDCQAKATSCLDTKLAEGWLPAPGSASGRRGVAIQARSAGEQDAAAVSSGRLSSASSSSR
mmetsp:Transcript_45006/g.106907  ORF Transcript_45006/g.106907 Transcript_45006/m.106907 type:complete len:114 (+) Transcript_45006:72-413(+)